MKEAIFPAADRGELNCPVLFSPEEMHGVIPSRTSDRMSVEYDCSRGTTAYLLLAGNGARGRSRMALRGSRWCKGSAWIVHVTNLFAKYAF